MRNSFWVGWSFISFARVIRQLIPGSREESLSASQHQGAPVGCRLPRLSSGDHKRAIPPEIKRQIKDLHQSRDNVHGLLFLGIDWLVILAVAGITVLSGFHLAVYAVAIIVIGSRQRALRSLLHEASHYKFLRNRKLNLWIGRLFVAFPLLEGVSGYLCSHCEHHRHLWDTELDPKRRQYAALGIIRPRNPGRFTRRHLLRPLLLLHVPYNVLSALLGRDEQRRETWLRVTWLVGVAATVIAFGWTLEIALLWLVPYLTTYQIFRYWSDIGDHAGLEVDDPWQATRSWTAPWLVRQLIAPHNANLHLSHHLYPIVPQHRIPQLHRMLSAVPEYQQAHHCHGFLLPSRPDRPSVIQDVLRPEGMREYHRDSMRNRGRTKVLRALVGQQRSPGVSCDANATTSCAETCPLGTMRQEKS
jgi:fatty acid desaturase